MSANLSPEELVTKEKLISDFKVVVSDAEELLRATASQAGEKASAARERIEASLRTARRRLEEAEDALMERARGAARVTDAYVHDHPWKAVGVAAAAGFLLGLLVNRR